MSLGVVRGEGQPAREHARYNCRMKLLELTLPTPAENLALDEALLAEAEAASQPREVLRLWESPTPMVVLGRASQVEQEADISTCRKLGVPIYRRHSGGAAVVAGPGCLMYAVVLSYDLRPHLRMIDQAHRFVLDALAAALANLRPDVQCRGTSDLTLGGRMKFSGNSLRCCRTHLLYHGTLLYDFPLELIGQCLKQPPRQPDYRDQRTHRDFVVNLNVSRGELRDAVVQAWATQLTALRRMGFQPRPETDTDLQFCPATSVDDQTRDLTAKLAAEKYTTDQWNLGR